MPKRDKKRAGLAMKKILAILFVLASIISLAACSSEQILSSQISSLSPSKEENTMDLSSSNIVIIYDAEETGNIVEQTVLLLQETLGGDLYEIETNTINDFSAYEFILLGFTASNNNLPQQVRAFLQSNDLGARTIYPFFQR